jgi:phosphate/sulfate permease
MSVNKTCLLWAVVLLFCGVELFGPENLRLAVIDLLNDEFFRRGVGTMLLTLSAALAAVAWFDRQ